MSEHDFTAGPFTGFVNRVYQPGGFGYVNPTEGSRQWIFKLDDLPNAAVGQAVTFLIGSDDRLLWIKQEPERP